MSFPQNTLFAKIELDIVVPISAATLLVKTDVPGFAMATRATITVPVTTRRPVAARLPFNCQGHLIQLVLTPGASSKVRLYGCRVWARVLPDGRWNWYPIPVVDTPVGYSRVNLPIQQTPEEWSRVGLPIAATGEEYSRVALPVMTTPDDWRSVPLPIPPTPEDWSTARLPIKATPPVPDWIPVEVDG